MPVEPFLTGNPINPALNERGWKNTVIALPGNVTRIKLRFAPQDSDSKKVKPCVNLFPFDPTFGPGYVWHCHLINHEDNEMMRPLKVVSCHFPGPNPQTYCRIMVEGSTQLVPPARKDAPIHRKNTVHAHIEKVGAENVVISGFIRRTITYTAVLDNGLDHEKVIVDEYSFPVHDRTGRRQ